jgi:transcriptional regulator with XRE-family HTH domain
MPRRATTREQPPQRTKTVEVAIGKWAEHGARLRGRREELGRTRQQCADLAGITANYWSQIEGGKTALTGYERRVGVAKALDLDLATLAALWAGVKVQRVTNLHAHKNGVRRRAGQQDSGIPRAGRTTEAGAA